jgi:hypothetical protein
LKGCGIHEYDAEAKLPARLRINADNIQCFREMVPTVSALISKGQALCLSVELVSLTVRPGASK